MNPDYFRTIRDRSAADSDLASTKTPHERGFRVRAGDRARTGDIQLGRLALYQLSYTRVRLA
jgi:hypothetical protein